MKMLIGKHCETTATGTLLANLGIDYAEPMIFGLGEGLSYGVLKFGGLSFPFIGGRIRTGMITENICRNLGLKQNVLRTTSLKKAWNNVKVEIDKGVPVGLQLDCYYLDYFTSKVHFAGHFVAMTGYDEKFAYLVDTAQQGGEVKTSLESLAQARSVKQPMSENNLSYTILKEEPLIELPIAMKNAIRNNAKDFLNPPIRNFGYIGIAKTADELMEYYKESENVEQDFTTTAMLMERAGTGGGLFRNIYCDFLKEAIDLLEMDCIRKAYELFKESAVMWTEVANLFNKVGQTKDQSNVRKISEILKKLSHIEYDAMTYLSQV